MAGRAVFRAIFFIPVIISTGIVGTIEAQNTAGDYMESAEGIDDGSGTSTASEIVSAMDVEAMFSGMAVGQGLVEYVTTAINNIYDIVNRSGVQMLIFLAGLQSISPAIYESVQIDGATSWETFWKITFPMISPMILVNAVYTIIDSFTAESNVVMSFISGIYQQANGNVVSSAMSWMYFLIVIAIIAIVAAIFSAFVFYQRRD
jgi:ABC-type sugar transport system permease subunit